MSTSKLIGKKAKIQLMEDGIMPDPIVHVCKIYGLNPVAFIEKEWTIASVQERVSEFDNDVKFHMSVCEHFDFAEILTDWKGRHHRRPHFPAEYFQIAMTNHPLTNIFC